MEPPKWNLTKIYLLCYPLLGNQLHFSEVQCTLKANCFFSTTNSNYFVATIASLWQKSWTRKSDSNSRHSSIIFFISSKVCTPQAINLPRTFMITNSILIIPVIQKTCSLDFHLLLLDSLKILMGNQQFMQSQILESS